MRNKNVLRSTFYVLCFLVVVGRPLFAASFHPFHGWRTIDTKHFSVHYHNQTEEPAGKVARYLEEAYESLSPKYEWKPWGRTQVIVTDNNDDSNGMASTLPFNWMLIRVVPPDPDSSLNTYDDWLKVLVTHEYTHILHLDADGGFWRPFRWVLGKTVSPAGFTPGWIREGTATLEETLGTEGGRGRASYSEMLVRTAVLENKFPTIDRAGGVHWKWPGGQTQYIFGVKFLDWLRQHYGEEKLQAFHRKTQKSFFLFAVNKQAKKVFGKSFYKLWREWQLDLQQKYRGWEARQREEGFTALTPYLTGEDSYTLPTFSRDGKKLAYVSLSPKRAAQFIVKDLESGEKKIVSKKIPSQISFSPDGNKLVFSAFASHKRFYFYSDLFEIDLEKKDPKEKRLTRGERARDPDWSPDGKTVLFVSSENGTDRFKTYDLESKKTNLFASSGRSYTQLAHPRYSPDGSKIVLVRFREKEGWELCVAGAEGKFIKKVPQEGLSVVSRPVWAPDGNGVIYSSDENGVANLYFYSLNSGEKKRLTNVKTGLFQPTLSSDGSMLLARHYHGEGYDVVTLPFVRGGKGGVEGLPPPTPPYKGGEKNSATLNGGEDNAHSTSHIAHSTAKQYSPFRTSLFLPRYLSPGFYLLDNGALVSLATGSMDPLRYHSWQAGASYRTDAAHVGYFGQYLYNRFKPVWGFGVNDFAVDNGAIFANRADRFFEERRNLFTFLSMPLGKGHSASAGYFYEDRMSITTITTAERNQLNLGVFAGLNFSYFFGTSESYPASISSVEKGRSLRFTGTVTDHSLLANENNEQKIVTGDYREFIPLGRRNVLAFRLAGGAAFADAIVPGTFSFGGSLGEGVMASQPSARYYSFRGLPVGSLIRDRVLISSLEYRMPLVSPQRGPGTWPIFLNNLHLGWFTDVGDAWDDRDTRTKDSLKDFIDDFFVSVGLEGRADFVIGHGLPVTGRLGYAIVVVNRDRLGNLEDPFLGNRVKNGIVILQFGTSF